MPPGYGTLTWFTPQKVMLTGSNIPQERHYIVSSQVSGVMLHGKFEERLLARSQRRKNGRAFRSSDRPLLTLKQRRKNRSPSPRKKATSPAPMPSPTSANDSLTH